jgi:hypothetical protein
MSLNSFSKGIGPKLVTRDVVGERRKLFCSEAFFRLSVSQDQQSTGRGYANVVLPAVQNGLVPSLDCGLARILIRPLFPQGRGSPKE